MQWIVRIGMDDPVPIDGVFGRSNHRDADIAPDTEVFSGRLRQSGRSIQNDRRPDKPRKNLPES